MFGFKPLFCIAILLVCIPAAAQAQIEKSQYCSAEFQYSALEAVARITWWDEKEGSQGSGVCVGYDGEYTYLLSCAHVIKGADKAVSSKIEFFSKASYPNPSHTHTKGFKFWTNDGYDLALLKVRVKGNSTIKICPYNASLKWNIPVLSIGCGTGAPPVCQVGKLIAQDELYDFVINRGGIGGRSGGAVITAHGLIGIHARGGNDKSYAVNYWKIHKFLTKIDHAWLLSGSTPPPKAPTFTTWSGAENLAGFGKLTFKLYTNGTAVMLDAKGTVNGKWAVKDGKVLIAFNNCLYVGQIEGTKMIGGAQYVANDQLQGQPWAFAVEKQ